MATTSSPGRRPGARTALLLAPVLALPLGRGLYRLGTPNVWLDEAATWHGITGSWRRLLDHAARGDDCGGICYAAVMKLWTGAAGTSEAALRLPSAVFTALLAATLFAVGRRLWGDAAGLYSGLMVGLYPVVFLQSRQARCYALELLLYALALLGLVLFLQGRRRAGGGLLAAAGSLLVVTHVFGVFALAGLAAVAAVAALAPRALDGLGRRGAREERPPLRRLLAGLAPFLPPLAVLAAWLLVLWARIEQSQEEFWLRGSIARTYLGLVEYVLPPALAAVVLWWGGARSGRRLAAAGAVLLPLPILLGPLAASLTAQGSHHFVHERYFLTLAVPGALALGYLLSRLRPALAAPAAGLVLVAALLKPGVPAAYSRGAPYGTLSADAAAYLREHRGPGEPLFVSPGFERLTLAYYGEVGQSAGGWDCAELPARLSSLRSGPLPRRVWVAHFGCPPERLPPPSTREVGRRAFGPLEVVELALEPGPTAPGA